MKWKNSHLGAKNNAAVHPRNLPCQDKNIINLKNTVDKSNYQASRENIQNKVLVQKNELRNIKDRFLPTQMKWHVSLKHSNIFKRSVDSIIPSKVINDLFPPTYICLMSFWVETIYDSHAISAERSLPQVWRGCRMQVRP